MPKIMQYATKDYDFISEVARFFDVSPEELSSLHTERADLLPEQTLKFETESKTKFHNLFYAKLNSEEGREIKRVYQKFISDIVYPIFKESIVYQAFPTFRIHLPEDQAIHYWHWDSDPDHMHPPWEVNFQIALTDIRDTQAMWIESVPSLGDHAPIEMGIGEFAIFDGNRCEHGNKVNKTGKTRLSFDFRAMRYTRYNPEHTLVSATKKNKFVIGGYYSLFEEKKNV